MVNKEMAVKLERFLFTLSSAIRNKFKEEIKCYQDRITEQQFKVLMVLKRRRLCKTSEISDAFSVSPGSMSIMLSSLVNEGFIERLPSDEDRRVILLKLTNKGEVLVEEIYNKIIEMIESLIGRLDKNEKMQLNLILEKLQKMISEDL